MKARINGGKPKPQSVYRRDGSARTAGAITKSAGGYAIADTSTTAKVGDVYRAETATTAAMVYKEYDIIEASTNSFTIASKDLPVLGDTFYILAPVLPRVGSDGAVSISTAGLATSAKQDSEAVLIGAVNETAPVSDTASSGLNGRLQRAAQNLTTISGKLPATLGSKADAAALAVTQSTEDKAVLAALSAKLPASLGIKAAAASLSVTQATEDAARFPASLGAKAAASAFPVTDSTEDIARMGIVTETAPVSDTASSGLNGRLQRVAQNITSLIAKLPSALGSSAAASSLAVTASTEDIARVGIVTETAPASDTASSGLNGRLQRIAQRLTTLLAVFPATIDTNSGVKSASTLRMVIATDQPNLTTPLNFNNAQINGVAVTMGNGSSGTGVQRVTLASDSTGVVALAGKISANAPVRNDYTSVNVTTAAYTTLVASLTSACTEIEIFDSSGQTLKIATGAAASEVDKINVFPGGNGRVPLSIAAGTRISIKAVSATASVGEIDVNFYG